MNYANIRYEVKGSIAYITMNRPNALNAIGELMSIKRQEQVLILS